MVLDGFDCPDELTAEYDCLSIIIVQLSQKDRLPDYQASIQACNPWVLGIWILLLVALI